MRSDARSLDTNAAPDAVWRIWSDTSTWPAWNPDVQAVELDRPLGLGAAGTMTTRSGGRHRVSITGFEPGRGFVLQSDGLPLTRLLFRCEVSGGPTGGATISQSVSMSGLLAPILGPMAGPRIAESFTPLLKGLAAAAERP
jgi:hypothetical protein